MASSHTCLLAIECSGVRVRNTFIDASGEFSPEQRIGQPQSCPAMHVGLHLPGFCMECDDASLAKGMPQSPQSTQSLDSDLETLRSVSVASNSQHILEPQADHEHLQPSSPDYGVMGEEFCCTPTFDDVPVCDFCQSYPLADGFISDWMIGVGEGVPASHELQLLMDEHVEHFATMDEHGWQLFPAPFASDVSLSSADPVPSEPRIVLSLADALDVLPSSTKSSCAQTMLGDDVDCFDSAICTVIDAGAVGAQTLKSQQLPNPGSAAHGKGDCRPCAFFHANRCEQGTACQFCHLCDSEARRRMKKDKFASKKALKKVHSNANGRSAPAHVRDAGI